ncbi:heat-shock protein Hsp20 [Bacillus sp. MUM 116]|uniref:Hsp20/alpha crystallin family protein n=1 Tax=Bacillus sp. MUM 116 TaxID=1678002 RepID=UPI0008F591EA|nr:Hsp20/alpha crystallin family protein [Bacillus sp. MUM 116]OIK13254.1 heat-shock protein Hsp20 [Bacillus sp. MUM 116]
MNRKKNDHCYDLDQMEKWLENYFLDPLTSYCDMTQFRIDLYETEKDWIVEAVLDDYKAADLSVKVEDMKLIITALKHPSASNVRKERTIDFPFPIKNQKVCASFENGILEIFISKIEKGKGNNRFITLP